jgi:hypothetical protein
MSISPLAVEREEVQRDLWTRTAVAAGRLNRAHADLVDIAVELVEGGHWGDGGFRSPEHYFVVRAGLSPSHARDVVAVARRRSELSMHYDRVYLHLSTDGAWANGGGAIPRRLLDRFLSDGVVQPVWETDARPVSVGRAMRILPNRTRRLIEDRDRGCRFPGCTATRFVEIHHLHEWATGGATDDDNQVSLCPFHHDAIDRGDYRISGDPTRPDGLVVTNRYGLPLRPPTPAELAPPPRDPPDGDPPHPRHRHPDYQPPTGEPARWADIEIPPDCDLPAPVGPAPVPFRLLRPVQAATLRR